MARLLGIDVGTSGCKAVLIDEFGVVLKQALAEYPFMTPQPGWTEQDPQEWVGGVKKVIEAIGELKPDAIGLTGQMHGSVFLGRDNEVIRPALLWNDQRTAKECQEINERVGSDEVKKITGNPPLTGFQAPKILWLRNHEPHHFEKLKKVLLPKDYVRFVLSGEFATEVSDASGVGLLDLSKRNWSQSMLDELKLPNQFFPTVSESYAVTSYTKGGFAGLVDGIPIVGGGGDQAAGAIGSGIIKAGPVSMSLGTSGVVFTALNSPAYDDEGRVHTFCHANGGWHAMGVMLSCGGAVEWLKKSLFSHITYKEFDGLAESVPAGSRGVLFQPYLAGERSPIIDPYARGSWLGLSLGSDQGVLIRSVIEGVCFGLKGSYDVLASLGARAEQIRVTGGGSKSNLWLQILADVFEVPVARLETSEGPSYGAALLAGVGAKVFDSVEAAAAGVKETEVIHPSGLDYRLPLQIFKETPYFRDYSRPKG